MAIDFRVLAFALLLAVISGLLFGLAPALHAMRANLSEPLKEGSNRTTGGAGGSWARRVLVVSEVALALVLITSAALLVRSFIGLVEVDPGFDTGHVLTMKLSLPPGRYGTAGALERFSGALIERLHGVPGVSAAAVATSLPMENGPDLSFRIEGRKGGGDDGTGLYDADYRPLTPEMFAVLRLPVLRGRGFTAADRLGAPLVVLVNEAVARIAIGLGGAFAMTRLLGSLLVGVTARDPLTFALTPAVLAAVAVCASPLPALRASRLDPLAALREE